MSHEWSKMPHQFIVIHGIGSSESKKNSHREIVEPIQDRLPGSEVHFVQWGDLGFSAKRVAFDPDAKPLDPPFERLLAEEASPFLFDRLALLLQIRKRDMTSAHPLWTVQSNLHRGELRLLEITLDYVGDIEVYLRDRDRREAIQQRLRERIDRFGARGPVTLIGHSLGTLVAYDVLHQLMPDGAVRTLVTLGSPLENLFYLTQGFGLVHYNLRLDPSINWLNFYDVKDVIASKIISGDFAREPRDDWFFRWRLGLRDELLRESSDERRPLKSFWNEGNLASLRTNIGLNRESTAIYAHGEYWTSTAVVQLVTDLAARTGE